jgi:hypothetical protein
LAAYGHRRRCRLAQRRARLDGAHPQPLPAHRSKPENSERDVREKTSAGIPPAKALSTLFAIEYRWLPRVAGVRIGNPVATEDEVAE